MPQVPNEFVRSSWRSFVNAAGAFLIPCFSRTSWKRLWYNGCIRIYLNAAMFELVNLHFVVCTFFFHAEAEEKRRRISWLYTLRTSTQTVCLVVLISLHSRSPRPSPALSSLPVPEICSSTLARPRNSVRQSRPLAAQETSRGLESSRRLNVSTR